MSSYNLVLETFKNNPSNDYSDGSGPGWAIVPG